jgi:hypothetical protein
MSGSRRDSVGLVHRDPPRADVVHFLLPPQHWCRVWCHVRNAWLELVGVGRPRASRETGTRRGVVEGSEACEPLLTSRRACGFPSAAARARNRRPVARWERGAGCTATSRSVISGLIQYCPEVDRISDGRRARRIAVARRGRSGAGRAIPMKARLRPLRRFTRVKGPEARRCPLDVRSAPCVSNGPAGDQPGEP